MIYSNIHISNIESNNRISSKKYSRPVINLAALICIYCSAYFKERGVNQVKFLNNFLKGKFLGGWHPNFQKLVLLDRIININNFILYIIGFCKMFLHILFFYVTL